MLLQKSSKNIHNIHGDIPVRDNIESFLQALCSSLVALMCMVVYLLIGVTLAVSYVWLTGGTSENAQSFAPVAPVVALILVALGKGVRLEVRRHPEFTHFRNLFWGLVLWVYAPIQIFLYSKIMRWTGQIRIAKVLYEVRYTTFISLPLGALTFWILRAYWRDRRKHSV